MSATPEELQAEAGRWLVESRYPGEWPETAALAAAEALTDARDVLARMSSDLSARGVASAG
jgi:hypothetical protein